MTGSFINLTMASPEKTPVVGMGVTELCYTDRHPYTIVEVSKSGKSFWAQEDTVIRTDKNGMSECQSYEITPNPSGKRIQVRLTKKGWKVSKSTHRVVLGVRDSYHDYSF